jgi:UDP-glucose 4-epimerase
MTAPQYPRVLVTGATGFVGRAVVDRLVQVGTAVTASVRREPITRIGVREVYVPDLRSTTDWTAALEGCSAVVHCAGRVHVLNETASNPLAAYRIANVEGSVALAKQAAASGVRRFVFISSIKVNGEETVVGKPFRASDPPAPVDPYAISKLEAEQALETLAACGLIELVIIRPPLVYGPGVKANFLSLARWIARGLPLPLGGVNANRRSFVALANLVDLIEICLNHPNAAGQVFLVSDGEDLSTSDLLHRTARAIGVPSRLFSVPSPLLAVAARALGLRDLWLRLSNTLQVDTTATRERLGWRPSLTVDAGLLAAVEDLRGGVSER